MRTPALSVAIAAALLGTSTLSGVGHAKGPKPPPDEGASNNLSFPVILSDNAGPADFSPTYPAKTFATITSVDQCTTGVPTGSAVPVDILCYYDGSKVWWLQERTQNRWQAYAPSDPNPAATGGTPVDVSGVDVGDKLESATNPINSKQVRTEFVLVMDATLDPDFAPGVLSPFDPTFPTAETDPTFQTFQAFNMSGAVPGTDQSINEIQGTDFGPGPYATLLGGTGAMADPTLVKLTNEGIPVHATVYSKCARLIIQKIVDPNNLGWSSDVDDGSGRGGYWVGGALAPQENIAAWDGSYSAEINAGGSMIYGFNWNTKLIPQNIKSGTWRLTFALEGGPTDDPATSGKCAVDLNTVFNSTVAVNTQLGNPSTVLTPADMIAIGAHHGEGGLVYVDVPLK